MLPKAIKRCFLWPASISVPLFRIILCFRFLFQLLKIASDMYKRTETYLHSENGFFSLLDTRLDIAIGKTDQRKKSALLAFQNSKKAFEKKEPVVGRFAVCVPGKSFPRLSRNLTIYTYNGKHVLYVNREKRAGRGMILRYRPLKLRHETELKLQGQLSMSGSKSA